MQIIDIARPERPRIFIAEDSVFVIMMLEALCDDLGCDIVGPATQLDEAMLLATTEAIDAALLDVNLNGEFSWPVAATLQRRGVPFAFGTGYDLANILPPEFADAAVFAKPYRVEDVEQQLRRLLAGGRAAK